MGQVPGSCLRPSNTYEVLHRVYLFFMFSEYIDKAVDMIRRGRNSIVFLCEPSIKRAMMGYGATEEEARTCDITGCYEFVPRARGNTTIVA
ncbi:MAG: hypothetical protein GWP05_08375 [Anaerolineaceae bacterium]|nr:hypothetical protein [Anaerolineaceae bacterium]